MVESYCLTLLSHFYKQAFQPMGPPGPPGGAVSNLLLPPITKRLGLRQFDNMNRTILLSAITLSGIHCNMFDL